MTDTALLSALRQITTATITTVLLKKGIRRTWMKGPRPLADNQQRVVMFHLGEIHPEQAEVFLGAVRKVNSGEATVAQARAVAAKQLAALAPPAE